jgi:hypothetical protein
VCARRGHRLAAETWLADQGFPADDDEPCDDELDDAVPLIQSAAVAGRSAVHRQRKARRVQTLGGRPFQLPPLCSTCDGYSFHAGVVSGRSVARQRTGTGSGDRTPKGGVHRQFAPGQGATRRLVGRPGSDRAEAGLERWHHGAGAVPERTRPPMSWWSGSSPWLLPLVPTRSVRTRNTTAGFLRVGIGGTAQCDRGHPNESRFRRVSGFG